MGLQTHQAKSAKHSKTCECFLPDCNCPRRCRVSRRSGAQRGYASHDETPARCQSRALSAAFGLEAERHQNVGVLARDRELFAGRRPRKDRVSASDHKLHHAGFKVVAGDRPQFVTHIGFRRCGFAVGQVGDLADVANELHRFALCSRREPAAFRFDEAAFIAAFHVAQDRRVQRRVRRLTARAFPQADVDHRGNHLLRVHRFAAVGQNLQRCCDARELLFAARGFRRLFRDSSSCPRLGCRRPGRSCRALQPAGRFDSHLLSCRKVGRVPTSARILRVDTDRDFLIGHRCEIFAASFHVCLLHRSFSVWVSFVVGCHRQAAGTTRDNARLRFGFRPCESYRGSVRGGRLAAGGLHNRAQKTFVEPVEHLAKDVVLFQERSVRSQVRVSLFKGVDQGAKLFGDLVVRPANLLVRFRVELLHLGAKGGSFGLLRFVHCHGFVSREKGFEIVLPFGVNTHEPCIWKQLKRSPAVIRSLFRCFQASPTFAAVGRKEMSGWFAERWQQRVTRANVGGDSTRNGRAGERGRKVAGGKLFAGRSNEVLQFLEPFAKVLQRTDVFPIDGMVGIGGRHVLDDLVKVFEQGQSPDMRGGVSVFDSSGILCHGWVSVVGKGKFVFVDTHEPCGFRHSKRSSGKFLNVSRTRFQRPRLAIAACFPSPFAAVANLATLDDVDDRIFGDVLVIEVLAGVVFARFVHLRAAGDAGDAVFKGPVLLRHQTHFGVRPVFVAVLFEQSDQLVDGHVCVSVPVAGLIADRKFAEAFVTKLALVPTLGPPEAVEKPVEFRFAVAGIRSVPATFGARLLGVVPSAAAFCIEGEFYQSQDHLDVSDQFRFVERAGKGPNLDPVSAGGEVRQIQKVVAVPFAACLCRVFVAVRFDLFRPVGSFAAFGAGRSVDGAFVIRDQRNQAGQGRGVAVPRNRDVQPARFVDPCATFFDRVNRGFDVCESFVAAKDRRHKFAGFPSGRRANTSVAFRFPTRRQPGDRQTVVVSADRRRVGAGHVGFDFDAEGDVVCVHGLVSERRVNSFVECTWSHGFRNTSSEVRQ